MIVALIINSVVPLMFYLSSSGYDREEDIALSVFIFVVLNYFSYWINKNKHEDKGLGSTILTSYFFFVLFGMLPIQILEWILPKSITNGMGIGPTIFAIGLITYLIFIFNYVRAQVMSPPSYDFNKGNKKD